MGPDLDFLWILGSFFFSCLALIHLKDLPVHVVYGIRKLIVMTEIKKIVLSQASGSKFHDGDGVKPKT
jgi:succinate dehydrogenase/fumarate reductase cytochrome b subunit